MTSIAGDDMTSRLVSVRPLVSQFRSALHKFQTSDAQFEILKTVHPSSPNEPRDPVYPLPLESPRTLIILDSSFNPPSIAHRVLAQSALKNDYLCKHPGPYRLLLLFATMNADKDPSPAAFEQRVTLMTIFASDLLCHLQILSKDPNHEQYQITPIDIGVTKVPYYTDKTLAITEDAKEYYPNAPQHVHLIGFDTLTRFFNPKYYPSFDPPLSALDPYFDAGHALRGTLRPSAEFGSLAEQIAFVARLGDGKLETVGGKREWAERVEMVEEEDGTGVSSTKIRNAAKDDRWDEVGDLCTDGVADWIKSEGLYKA